MNFITNRSLNRRSFLKGTGVALALPMLDAMIPAFGAAPAPKRRMVAICTTLGIHGPHLFPEQKGRGYKASPYSQVIDEFRNDFTVFSGLSHPEVDGGHSSEASFLTAVPHPGVSGFKNGISLDQLAAEHFGAQTRYGSLVLTTSAGFGMSWTRSGVNIPAEDKPSRLFAKLFLAGTPDEVNQQVRRLKDGQSIMDTVGGQAKSLQRSVSATDKEKLDQYFTSVRELEQRLVQAESWVKKPKPVVTMKPPADPTNRADIIGAARPLFDLIHLALQTDSTRVVTLRLQGLNSIPPIEGVSQDWHNLSHHGKDPAKIDELAIIEKAELKELKSFLANLKNSREDGQPLLDRTMVLYGSNLGNASSHDTRNLPMLLAGGGFKHGQHLAFDPAGPPPLCNLYVQMLRQLGMDVNAFGSSKTTSLAGLDAA
jgi:hypothetical protein